MMVPIWIYLSAYILKMEFWYTWNYALILLFSGILFYLSSLLLHNSVSGGTKGCLNTAGYIIVSSPLEKHVNHKHQVFKTFEKHFA
jgi:hypothetical protein